MLRDDFMTIRDIDSSVQLIVDGAKTRYFLLLILLLLDRILYKNLGPSHD